jgi:hypothetical protein
VNRMSASVLLAVVALLGVADPVGAATQRGQHCYVRVIEQHADGELVTTEPACYATAARARQAATSSTAQQRAVNSFVLATHYDGPGWTGSSTAVYGSDCLGGWLNTSTYWANEMESTQNGCSVVRHFYGQNLTGASQATTGSGGNLVSPYYHHAWSVQYTT